MKINNIEQTDNYPINNLSATEMLIGNTHGPLSIIFSFLPPQNSLSISSTNRTFLKTAICGPFHNKNFGNSGKDVILAMKNIIKACRIFIDDSDVVEKDVDEKIQALQKKIDPAANDNEAIQVAAQNGHTETVRMLLEDRRVDPTTGNNRAITMAAKRGHTEIVRELLKDGRADPNARNGWVIILAAGKGHTKVLRMLLEDERVNPTNMVNNEAIRWATENGHTEIVKEFVKWAIENNRPDVTLDIIKKITPTDELVKWIIENGYAQEIGQLLLQLSYSYRFLWSMKIGTVRLSLTQQRIFDYLRLKVDPWF